MDTMLKERFSQMDKDKSGYLDKDEIKSGLKSLGYTKLKDADIDALIKQVDENKNGKVEYEEFVKLMMEKLPA